LAPLSSRSHDRAQVTTAGAESRQRLPGFLIVIPWDPEGPGGVREVVRNLLDQLAIRGDYEPILLVNRWSARRLEERPWTGKAFNLRLRPPIGGPRPWRTFAGFLVGAPRTVRDLLSLLRRFDVRVINVHYVEPSTILFGLLRRTGLFRGCLLLSMHGSDLHTARRSEGGQSTFWKITLRLADRIVACSDYLRDEIIALDSRLQERAVTVLNGVQAERLKGAAVEPWGLAEWLGPAKCILSVGKFDPVKGMDVLLRAFALLVQEAPNVRLVMVGASGGWEVELRELVLHLGLSDRVAMIKDVPHEGMGEFYSQAVVFCLPSRREALGLAVLEAGAFGLPVVATRVGGVTEIVEHGVTGRLVAPEEVSGLAGELKSLLDDPSERERLGKALREKVESEFTWTRAYSQYKAVIGECSIGGAHPSRRADQ
jgi:glycosyltransferase involved in cell wall biosynthesis